MREIRIKIENDMSKQDEIDIITKLRDTFTTYPDNYLASLFTMNFTQWVKNQIKNDFPPDAYDLFCGFECDNIKRELDSTKKSVETFQDLLKEFRETKTKLTLNIGELQTECSKSERDYEKLLNETADTEDELQKEIGCLEHEIVLLKAKLYDKITK